MKRLGQLNFDNAFARLPGFFHYRLNPLPLPRPYWVSFNPVVASLIDLNISESHSGEFTEYFMGNRNLPGTDPVAMLYARHQFAKYVSQLGDGRTIFLCEVINSQGERWGVQLKGVGPSP